MATPKGRKGGGRQCATCGGSRFRAPIRVGDMKEGLQRPLEKQISNRWGLLDAARATARPIEAVGWVRHAPRFRPRNPGGIRCTPDTPLTSNFSPQTSHCTMVAAPRARTNGAPNFAARRGRKSAHFFCCARQNRLPRSPAPPVACAILDPARLATVTPFLSSNRRRM